MGEEERKREREMRERTVSFVDSEAESDGRDDDVDLPERRENK